MPSHTYLASGIGHLICSGVGVSGAALGPGQGRELRAGCTHVVPSYGDCPQRPSSGRDKREIIY